jgi:hypothetical protein
MDVRSTRGSAAAVVLLIAFATVVAMYGGDGAGAAIAPATAPKGPGAGAVAAPPASPPASSPVSPPTPLSATRSPSSPPPAASPTDRSDSLAEGLRKAVDDQRFGEVVDFFAGSPAPRIRRLPNLDVAVIELDPSGGPVAAADVLLDDAHPHGLIAPIDRDLAAGTVRWRLWDSAAWATGTVGRSELVPGRAGPDFAAPYPASVFKLMVAYGVLREVDQGRIRLDEPYAYNPGGKGCPESGSGTRTVRAWLDAMLTHSDNPSTCAMIKKLHDVGRVDPLNAHLRGIGLATLRLGDTEASSGGGWDRAGITMTGMDTARLLLLVSGAPGVLWRSPTGVPVTADTELSPASRGVFMAMLGDQALNQVLSTPNWCGRAYPTAGIPQLVATRWLDPATGAMRVPGREYGPDVRPCNARAEVTFAHKTGLVDESGADAGVVTSLPGAAPRRYIVAVFSNLGCRFADPRLAADGSPCSRGGVRYSEKFAGLGKRIDDMLAAR